MTKRGKGRRNRQRREKRKRSTSSVKGLGKGWRTSSATMLATTCVEVARVSDTMYVRDSLDRDGPVLHFGVDDWSAFLGAVR